MWHLCSNRFTKCHYIRVFHHFMGARIPWYHLWGLHVVLVTITPPAQTPQPFQFLSVKNPEYVTLFSFYKKLFCTKNSQQIEVISLKKWAREWRLRDFWAGPLYRRRQQLRHPPRWRMAQVQPVRRRAASDTSDDGRTHTYSPPEPCEPRIHAGDELFAGTERLPCAATESGSQACRER